MKKIVAPLLLTILLLQMVSVARAWEIERPGGHIDILERDENAYTNGEASVGLGTSIDHYIENFGSPYGNVDVIKMNVSMTANSRKGITYTYSEQSLWWIPEDQLWYRSDRVGVGDDVVVAVDIPQDVGYFAFRFYGGLGSAEYQKVYVSTNGFIGFHNSTQPSPTPSDIPSSAEPNAIIAAVWTDLNIDSSASIITGLWAFVSQYYFVIIWKNALHKASGQRLTFQIILEDAPQLYPAERRYSQSQIWMSYNSVSSINTNFAYGIEDQQGSKGLGGLYSGSSLGYLNEATLWFYQYSNSFFLKRLTLSFYDANSSTEFNIWEDNGYYLRGYNIQWNPDQPSQPDGTYMFLKALAGTAALLIGGPAGLIVDIVLIGSDWVEYLAYRQYSGRQVEVFDREDGLQQQASATALTYDYVVDASLSIIIHWILKTENNVGTHSLTITANLEYYEYSILDGSIIDKPPVTTSVNLKIGPDDNDSPDKAQLIGTGTYDRLYIGNYDEKDYYKIHVDQGFKIDISAWATKPSPTSPEPYFYLFLYDPWGNQKASTGPGKNLFLGYTAGSTGYWLIEVRKDGSYGFYSLKVNLSYPGDGGGGCPFVYTWNGSEYVIDNNILGDSEASGGADVEDYYRLEQPLVRKQGKHSLLIGEFEQEHSYLDQVRLLAVDHESDVHVAVTRSGEILTYKNPVTPISAVDNNGTSRLDEVSLMDGDVSDPATYFYGEPGDYVILDFGNLDVSNGAKLVFRANIEKKPADPGDCIHVQVLDAEKGWVDIEVSRTRENWSTQIVDLADHLPDANGELKVRLYSTALHWIDYVGLDTTKQDEFQVHQANLVSAVHSEEGSVKTELSESDGVYAELVPSQQIELEFTLPENSKETRTYIIYVKGHYYYIITYERP